MEQNKAKNLEEPSFEQLGTVTLCGISRFYSFDKVAGLPDQWQSFAPLIHQVTRKPQPVTYGAIYNGEDDSFDYLTAVELPEGTQPPQNMVCLKLLQQTYAVFHHPGHVASLRETCAAIWSDWLPASGKKAVDAPWFERYGSKFDPMTGAGGLEVWIPVSD